MMILTLLILFFIFISMPYIKRQLKIRDWYKHLQLKKHASVYQALYKDVNGFILSQKARLKQDALEYSYGEISFISFIALLSCAKPDKHAIFYDLGSGTGHTVLACAMVFNVKQSCGIELFSPLHETALIQKNRLSQIQGYKTRTNNIHLVHGDFLTVDFHDATIIFINTTTFIGEIWNKLKQKLINTKPDTIIITTSKCLASEAFELLRVTTVQMSWGLVDAYIQRRHHTSKNFLEQNA